MCMSLFFSFCEKQLQMWEYKACTSWSWRALIFNYFIFQLKYAIFANFLHPFKNCHVALFWIKVYVVLGGTSSQFFPFLFFFHMVLHDVIFQMTAWIVI